MPADNTDDFDLIYDAWNRLVKVEDGENTVAEYEYDGNNQRVVKRTYDAGTLDETRHFYYTDEWQSIEERTESGGAIAANPDVQYVWGDRYVDNLILRDRDTTANGTLDERLYALQDANWNVTALAETDGTIIERYTYTAYGTLEVRDADFTPDADGQSDHDWVYTYTTRRLDAETGLMYYRNRMYHPEIGRFVSRDPIAHGGGATLYCYAAAMPLEMVDPLGLEQADPGGQGTFRNCTNDVVRRSFRVPNMARRFISAVGLGKLDVKGKFHASLKRCEQCCDDGTWKPYVAGSLGASVFGKGQSGHKEFPYVEFDYGLYVRVGVGGSLAVSYDGCKDEVAGTGCFTAYAELGLLGQATVKTGWIKIGAGIRGGINLTSTYCVGCNIAGDCQVTMQTCIGARARMWAFLKYDTWWGEREWEYYREWSYEACTPKIPIYSFQLK